MSGKSTPESIQWHAPMSLCDAYRRPSICKFHAVLTGKCRKSISATTGASLYRKREQLIQLQKYRMGRGEALFPVKVKSLKKYYTLVQHSWMCCDLFFLHWCHDFNFQNGHKSRNRITDTSVPWSHICKLLSAPLYMLSTWSQPTESGLWLQRAGNSSTSTQFSPRTVPPEQRSGNNTCRSVW